MSTIEKGERYETQELIDMGLLPPDWKVEPSEDVVVSTVTEVDHEKKIVTFDA